MRRATTLAAYGRAVTRMRVCQHCHEGFEAATTGRPPKYCSATCRKAAWEAEKLRQAVAAAKAEAVVAERRRVARLANRGNETPAAGNRGNETPAPALRWGSPIALWADLGEPDAQPRREPQG
jgi:hypothetical protein